MGGMVVVVVVCGQVQNFISTCVSGAGESTEDRPGPFILGLSGQ